MTEISEKELPARVIIAMRGFDVQRILSPLLIYKIERMHIFHLPLTRDYEGIEEEIKRGIPGGVEQKWHRIEEESLEDLPKMVGEIGRIINRELSLGSTVWINFASGSKIFAAASALAATYYGGKLLYQPIKKYTLPAKKYTSADGKFLGISKEVGEPTDIIFQKVKIGLDEISLKALRIIKEKGPLSATDIGLHLIEEKVLHASLKKEDRRKDHLTRAGAEKVRKALQPLYDYNPPLIEEEMPNKTWKKIEITKEGENFLSMFMPMIEK